MQDLVKGKRTRKNFVRGFTLHTKLVLTTTVILLFGGALLILALDWNNASSLGSLKPAQKAMAAFFQSVTTRTAGFETIPQANFSGRLRDGKYDPHVHRRLSDGNGGRCQDDDCCDSARGRRILHPRRFRHRGLGTEGHGRKHPHRGRYFLLRTDDGIHRDGASDLCHRKSSAGLLYEIVSAVATVGLTRSLTPTLPAAGKIIVILVMFMGRLGPVTLAIALRRRSGRKDVDIQRPEQRVLIG